MKTYAHSLSLFEDDVFEAPPTQGIKYAGSKLKLLPYILQMAQKVRPRIIFDGFSGSTRVSQAFAHNGCQVIANDLSAWSYEFGNCYLSNHSCAADYQELIDHLNALPEKDGWFTLHYGGSPEGISKDNLKKPWQIHNTRKLDAIREEMENLELSRVEKSVALASLMLSLDEVDSTLGHYASYLNQWSPRSYKQMKLKVPQLRPQSEEHEVFRGDIFDILPKVEADLAYFDPPYGSNNEKMPPSRVRYSAYYHLWTSICLFDKPEVFGKAGRRADSSDKIAYSPFEDFRANNEGDFIAVEAIARMLEATRARHILLSYSSGGRATAQHLREAIEQSGRVIEIAEIDYKRNVMATMRWTNQWVNDAQTKNKEFLFLIEKD